MLISFSVQNWMSFQETASISMAASKEKQHGDRVPVVEKYRTRILPLAVVYGGNASGKTNLFKALSFIKNLVVRGTHPSASIPVEVFRLDPKDSTMPARFSLELLIDEKIYAFSFAVTRKAIREEKLVEIATSSEKILYERIGGQITFDKSLEKDQALHFVFKGTRDNQLFLTNSISQKVERFKAVYDWFESTLQLVAPDSRFGRFERFLEDGNPTLLAMKDALSHLDTGITNLDFETVQLEDFGLPTELLAEIEENLREGAVALLMLQREPIAISRRQGKTIARKLVTFHANSKGESIKFGMEYESDGSRRVIDLLPVFLDLCTDNSHKVYVIDELDRSLHTLLTRNLLEGYLASCSPQSRAQLLFTTHDVLVMDQDLLRRDEMWVTERTASGGSSLTSFSEFKDVRYDKDIRKSYLQGRLGGIPRMSFDGRTTHTWCVNELGGTSDG
jgi:AAA15 family ATPase/GTPase